MSEQVVEKKEKDNKKLIIIIIITVALLIIGGLTTAIVLLLNKEDKPASSIDKNFSEGKIKYEQGIIALKPDDLQAAYDEAVNKVKDGYITLNFNNWAESTDGKHFDCYFGNSSDNNYDVYYDMYLDSTLSERVFITGLIPPGSGIDNFESELYLDPGTYEAVLVLTQIESDHATIHAQTSVMITLKVKG